MSNPEVTRLGHRVQEQDETIRAISDAVLDIKESVDQHTQVLNQHTELLNEILRRLETR
ncbi:MULTISPECIES: hypothetical protein [unclassified Pseudonocardia]|uniref:hypothetical protein n=1 Tax=unclassified Pseudonocardia TaxID=2619320 RepID=UPI00143B3C06|nr:MULTISPECIES: hypothetical protein [unclassified Pseudonocardia]